MKTITEEKLISEYKIKEKTNIDEALMLDKKCKRPAYIFSYVFGIIGTLVLGVGMCLAMKVIADNNLYMAIGVIVGLIGIIMVSINYPLFNLIMKKRKEKYSSAILLALAKKNN